MFKYLTLDNFDFNNKIVAVRLDLNSPIIDGEIVKTKHISRSMKTIRELLRKGAKVVLLAHQGRYNNKDTCISLKKHLELLKDEVKVPINFIDKFDIEHIKKNISQDNFNIHLLENLRFLEDEINYNKKDNFILSLETLFDYYVLEDFSLLHNNHTSIAHIENIKVIAGRMMERELSHLKKINDLKAPKVFLFGGSKVEEVLNLIRVLLKEKNVDKKIILTGIFGELALKAKGYDLGKKEKLLEERKYLDYVNEIDELIKKYPKTFIIPIDVAYFDGKNRVEIDVRDFDLNVDILKKYEINDIGMNSINLFEKVISDAKSIFFKGPAGVFEKEEFEKGSKELIRTIINSKAFSFTGGNHTNLALEMFNMNKQITYVSFAGTALIDFLSKKDLPGLKCIENSYKKYYDNEYDFIVIGSNVMDIKVDVPEKLSQLDMGSKVKIDNNFIFNTGGGGVNVSITISKIGSNVGYLGKISTENKELLLKTLEKNNISLIPSKETKKFCAKSILLQTQDNDRVILTFRGHNSYFDIEDIDLNDLKSNNFYFTSLNDLAFQTQVKIAKYIKKKNLNSKICFNLSSHAIKSEKKVKDLIVLTDVLIFNFDEAKELTGERSINECLEKVYAMGPRLVVITDGIQGTYAYNGSKQYFQKAREAKKVVDTTGAGDCFAATFFNFYAKGYGIQSSLRYAAVNSANLVSKTGTQNGLLDYNELIKKKIV